MQKSSRLCENSEFAENGSSRPNFCASSAMIRKDQVARIPANDMETQRILIASLFAIAV
jgi:hypothetical protein